MKRTLRGSTLEEQLHLTNELYKKQNLAIIQKISTPITPVKFDKETKFITLAYFEKKSTVDFIGIVQGLPICFDAKETTLKNFPLQNIHLHQIDFMEHFVKQGGLAFVLVHFVEYSEYFYLPFEELQFWWNKARNKGRKSIPYSAFNKELLIPAKGAYIDYLQVISKLANNG